MAGPAIIERFAITERAPSPRWTDIPGWLSEAEGEQLRELARAALVLELGSYLGRSTVAMAQVAVRLVSIDWHGGDEGTGPSDTFRGFVRNLAMHGVSSKVEVIRGRIEARGQELGDDRFDLVFIDGAHDVASVRRDTALARRVVRPGGVIAWHDWQYESVRKGAGSVIPDGIVGSLAWKSTPTHAAV